MHAVGCTFIDAPHEVLVERLGQERRERREHVGQRREALVKRVECGALVVTVGGLPEPAPVAAHVPVRELVHERLDGRTRGLRVEAFERVRNVGKRALLERDGPTVDLGSRGRIAALGVIDVLEPGVQHEETVGVPERVDERTRDIGDDVDGDAFLHVGRDAREEIPAQRIGADRVEHVVGVEDITERLGHLLAIGVDDVAQADHVPVGNTVGDERRDGMQRVEPAARLVDGLADVVGGEVRLELVGVLERVMPLGVAHRARVEPAVDDLGHAPPGAAIGLERDVVDGRAVQVEITEVAARQFRQLGH